MREVIFGASMLASGTMGVAGIILAVTSLGNNWLAEAGYMGLLFPLLLFSVLAVSGLVGYDRQK